MKYDLIAYTAEILWDAPDDNIIRVNGLTQTEAYYISEVFVKHGVAVCLLPYEE